jgi:hypothetical protein
MSRRGKGWIVVAKRVWTYRWAENVHVPLGSYSIWKGAPMTCKYYTLSTTKCNDRRYHFGDNPAPFLTSPTLTSMLFTTPENSECSVIILVLLLGNRQDNWQSFEARYLNIAHCQIESSRRCSARSSFPKTRVAESEDTRIFWIAR